MKYKKPILTALVLVSCLVLFCSMPVFAAELTEAQVEEAVAEQGKEAVTGNVFIWFLCAIAFLKVSQKIDSFMASLGINVGNTGGNMMAELLIAGRGLAGAFHGHGGGGGYRRASSPGSAAVGGSFLSGGLARVLSAHVVLQADADAGGQRLRSRSNGGAAVIRHHSGGVNLRRAGLPGAAGQDGQRHHRRHGKCHCVLHLVFRDLLHR